MKESYHPHDPHIVRVYTLSGGEFEYLATFSGVVNEPDRLWIEEASGKRTYHLLCQVDYYSIGD
jgi:hypothetical protein